MAADFRGSENAVARCVWLLGTEPVPKKRISREEFDTLVDVAATWWQVLPVIVPRLAALGAGHEEGPSFRKLSRLSTAAASLSRVQHALLRRYTQQLDKQHIPYVLLKGSATGLTLYPTPAHRCSMDIDVGVSKEYLPEAEYLVRHQGFTPASLDESGRRFFPVGEEDRAFEKEHYELACMVRQQIVEGLPPEVEAAIRESIPTLRPWHLVGNEVGCYVTFDIHHGLSLDIDLEPVIASARWVEHGDYRTRVPPDEWQALHLVFKIYWEGVHNYRKGMYQFADLVRLAPRLQGQTAAAFIGLLRDYSLEAAGYFVLRRLASEFGIRLAPELASFVLDAIEAPHDAFPSEVNDAGDMWPKICGYR